MKFFITYLSPFIGFDLIKLAALSVDIRKVCIQEMLWLESVDFYFLIHFLYRHYFDCPISPWRIHVKYTIFNYIGCRLFKGTLPGLMLRRGRCSFARNGYIFSNVEKCEYFIIDKRLYSLMFFLQDSAKYDECVNFDAFFVLYDFYKTLHYNELNSRLLVDDRIYMRMNVL